MSAQPVLITGATGFLGGALALRLADAGVPVRALVRSPHKAAALRDQGVEIVGGDLTDPATLNPAVEGCRVVFHVAAALSGSYAQQHAVNVIGTRHLLEAASAAGVERFVHVSSISVYGFHYTGDVTEEMKLAPGADPYGITKAEGEQVVRAARIPYTIIRPGMIYGPGSVNWTGGLFRLARLNPTPFIGAGHGSTMPIHVDDVVDLLAVAADHPAAVNQIFNCTPDPAPSWREFLGHYARLAGHDRWLALPLLPAYVLAGLAMLVSPPISMGRNLPDQLSFMQRQITYKMDKARALLGWSPHVDLASGVESCVPWLREQGLLS